ncbi:hypothetical protein HOLleu_35300 [Holothuria leucospilota]|uniref:Uncharacterized protein n=1 Tax=Holothuria leucospilota TaxID=206669 RepID=A0A9Q1BHN9_HOLLE|nr:hypothetical protein HOLleu_35300 [Holothuria leucospilota]
MGTRYSKQQGTGKCCPVISEIAEDCGFQPALPVKISENSTQDEVKEEEDSLIPEMDLSDEEVEIIDEDDRGR